MKYTPNWINVDYQEYMSMIADFTVNICEGDIMDALIYGSAQYKLTLDKYRKVNIRIVNDMGIPGGTHLSKIPVIEVRVV